MHELLNLAKTAKADTAANWDLIFAKLTLMPDIVNLRPESRDFGLIHFAVHQLRHVPAERLLLEFKADVHLKTREGHTCVELVEHAIETRNSDPRKPPSAATRKDDQDLLRLVKDLENGSHAPHLVVMLGREELRVGTLLVDTLLVGTLPVGTQVSAAVPAPSQRKAIHLMVDPKKEKEEHSR